MKGKAIKIKDGIIKWLRKHSFLIILIVLVFIPIIVALFIDLPFFDKFSGSNDGWLGFWGGYLGSIVAILGVYWQMREENKQWKEDINREKREKYVEVRPFLTMNVNYDCINRATPTAYFTNEYVKERKLALFSGEWRTYILRICNLSSSNLYSVRIKIQFYEKNSESVYINQIESGKEYQIISNNIDHAFQNKSEKGYEFLPTSIEIYFYTEKREKAINMFKNITIPSQKYFEANPLASMSRIGYPLYKELYEIDSPQSFNGKIQNPMFSRYFVESQRVDNK